VGCPLTEFAEVVEFGFVVLRVCATEGVGLAELRLIIMLLVSAISIPPHNYSAFYKIAHLKAQF
tara:strand:+ start:300 stop:491 length:192 start_codon:yes stop_codon:yes gene_type:complete